VSQATAKHACNTAGRVEWQQGRTEGDEARDQPGNQNTGQKREDFFSMSRPGGHDHSEKDVMSIDNGLKSKIPTGTAPKDNS